jgi:predicted nucleic-acid-binding protein
MNRSIENPDYAAFLKRIIRAYSKRIAEGDIEALADLSGVIVELDHAIMQAIKQLRAQHGYSWADIARPLGITRQAAQQRWGGDSS